MEQLKDMIAKLNPEQFRAVMHSERNNLLIFAGAGSGKTRVLTLRIAWLLANGLCLPEEILACTFTRKSAAELRERVEKMVGKEKASKIRIGTMHSICSTMMTKKKATLLDEEGRKDVLIKLFKKEVEAKNPGKDPKWILSDIGNAISSFKNKTTLPSEARESGAWYADEYTRYTDHLVAIESMDFDDLIFNVVNTLKDPAHELYLKHKIHAKTKYVFVDEYQDTNLVQSEFIKLMSGGAKLCVVGDDDQSIYGWRGAEVSLIQEHARQNPDTMVIELNKNYRSWGTLVRAAHCIVNRVSSRAKTGQAESNKTTINGHGGDLVTVQRCSNGSVEASWIADQIKLGMDAGKHYNTNAILVRTNKQKDLLRLELDAHGIPHMDSEESLYTRQEVVDTLDKVRHDLSNSIIASTDDAYIVLQWAVKSIGFDMTVDCEQVRALSSLVDVAKARNESIHDFLTALHYDMLEEPVVVSDKVLISTVHGAKGLEFDTVFIAGLEDGIFPSKQSLRDKQGWLMDEERRLMYVAMTRAMERLVITYCDKREVNGVIENMVPSMFLSDLHPSTLDVPEPILIEIEIKEDMSVHSVSEQVLNFIPQEGKKVFHKEKGNGLLMKIRGIFADVRFSARTETVLLSSIMEEQTVVVDMVISANSDIVVVA